ncbi:protein phosphatase 1 regulatory subunit 3E-like isoform X2 [Glandiceps talaboti]
MDCTALGCLKTLVGAFTKPWSTPPSQRPRIKYSPLTQTCWYGARLNFTPLIPQQNYSTVAIQPVSEQPRTLEDNPLPNRKASSQSPCPQRDNCHPYRKPTIKPAEVTSQESPRTYRRIVVRPRRSSRSRHLKVHFAEQAPEQKYLEACFPQPEIDPEYLQNVQNQRVCLERIAVSDLTILGTVRVANISYHKVVKVRFTANQWKNQYDISACYVQGSCDGPTDRFAFGITPPRFFGVGDQIELAIYYEVDGVTYWDNNNGDNYVLECYTKTNHPPKIDTLWTHFA